MPSASNSQETWRQDVTDPGYAAMLRELDELGCHFEWRETGSGREFVALRRGEVVAQQRATAHAERLTVVYDVLNQAADQFEILP